MDTRLGPLSDADQRVERYELVVRPGGSARRYGDGFGNAAHLITLSAPHRFLEVVARSELSTLLDDPFALPEAAPAPLSAAERWDALAPSSLVQRSDELAKMAAPFRPAELDGAFEAVRRLMSLVYEQFDYQKDSTNTGTTVEDILRERRGVCQDFAHLLIGLCRAIEIPARYVSGYIVQSGQSQSQQLGSMRQSQGSADEPRRGGGASHAWAEAFTPTHGWRGFDPTNNLVASAHHVKMAIGRDYADVPPTRGTDRGGSEGKLSVDVATRVL
jgi:transglutaminase-like putative cysteine protease